MNNRRLRVGLVGGGQGSFFAHPHIKAIHMDGKAAVVAAALRSNPEAAIEDAKNWAFPIKGYASYQEMIQDQKNLPENEKLDYIVIVTPNHAHYDPAKLALEAGIPVFCEKPLTLNLSEAQDLKSLSQSHRVPFAVAHTYLGHWSSRFSRFLVQSGLIGEVRWVDSSYLQGWLAHKTEEDGQKQAAWRTDPSKTGISNCGGDIGTHAYMQLRYLTGLEVEEVSARLESFVEGRNLDDHFTTYCKLSNGSKALIRATQIAIGHKNNFTIEINGSHGSLIWKQEESECVRVLLPDQPDRIYWRGDVFPNDGFLNDIPEDLLEESTLPSGHSEGFHDALARLHRSFAQDVRSYNNNDDFHCDGSKYANVEDGRLGVAFINAAVSSNQEDGAWKTIQ